MPAWGEKLSDEEIRAVLVYLKPLWGPTERKYQAPLSPQPTPTNSK